MPLTLEMVSASGTATGKFIIDRNNIIFVFYPPEAEAKNNLMILDTFHKAHKITENLPKADASTVFVRTDDPRHDALEHMSSYDRHSRHLHTILTKDVDLTVLNTLFRNYKKACGIDPYSPLNQIMSKKNREDILQTAVSYFQEQKENKQAEDEYRSMKDKEIERANDSVRPRTPGRGMK